MAAGCSFSGGEQDHTWKDDPMRLWLICTFICGYLSFLSFGIFAHTLGVYNGSHPVMYFVVWDMFCSWSAYSTRVHVIGEGASGSYYELAPGPWGEFRPYGELARHHYDDYMNGFSTTARHTLAHTEHEPITRIMLVEETWSKRYNLNESAWQYRYEGRERDVQKYYYLRGVMDHDGRFLFLRGNWLGMVYQETMQANPRLMAERHLGQPAYAIESVAESQEYTGGSLVELPDTANPAPLGN